MTSHRHIAHAASVPSSAVGVFERLDSGGYEQVVWCHDPGSGLRAIIAIHSTVLGPALGGTRFHAYADEDEALTDVLRLAKAMSYKAAVSGLDLGGGKAVILGDPEEVRSEPLLRAYGRFVDSLGGRYVTAEDVGTTQADMDLILRETRHVTGVSESLGGSGDPSPATALGVLHATRAVAEHLWGDDSLDGRHVVVSGVGKVGSALVDHLAEEGATLTVADVDKRAVDAVIERHPSISAVAPEEAHRERCDIFAPCALGAVLTSATIAELRCAAVCGAANNQLGEPADAERLAAAGVLYAPDYVVNAGGIINIAEELHGYDRDRAWDRVAGIRQTTANVLATAEAEGITSTAAADRIAERRIDAIHRLQHIRTFSRS